MLNKKNPLKGEVTIPGDKSISHRAVMFGALAEGTTEVTNFLQGADCLSTIDCFRKLGIEIDNTKERILIHGKGLHGLKAPSCVLGQDPDQRLAGDEPAGGPPARAHGDPCVPGEKAGHAPSG